MHKGILHLQFLALRSIFGSSFGVSFFAAVVFWRDAKSGPLLTALAANALPPPAALEPPLAIPTVFPLAALGDAGVVDGAVAARELPRLIDA